MQITDRRNKILDLISLSQIETQEEIAAGLKAAGFGATQATISRDIKELGLIKVAGSGGKQFYIKDNGVRQTISKHTDIAYSCIRSVEISGKLLVIKTEAGFGKLTKQAVCAIGEVMGSVADEDTVFVTFLTEEAATVFHQKLTSLTMY